VVEALRTVEPGPGTAALAALGRPSADPYRVVLPGLLNELQVVGSPLFLVLDDYHLITNPACHQTLTFFLDHLPAGVHLALSGRIDPPLPCQDASQGRDGRDPRRRPDLAQLPPAMRRSLTWDRGREMAQHQELAAQLGIDVDFCDPRSPWQRGSNENTNRLLRQYLSEGADLRQVSMRDSMTLPSGSTPGHGARSTGRPRPICSGLASAPSTCRKPIRIRVGFRRHTLPDVCSNGARWRARHTIPSAGSSLGLDSIRSTVKPSRS
jgi:hypothetical protein